MVTNFETEIPRSYRKYSKVVWLFNANRNEHAGKKYANQRTRLFAKKEGKKKQSEITREKQDRKRRIETTHKSARLNVGNLGFVDRELIQIYLEGVLD